MTSPCPCRGCTVAYKQGCADQHSEWQDVLSSTNRRAANDALDRARDGLAIMGIDDVAVLAVIEAVRPTTPTAEGHGSNP